MSLDLSYLTKPPELKEFRFRRAIRIAIFYTIAIIILLIQHSKYSYLAAIAVFGCLAYYKYNPQLYGEWFWGCSALSLLYLVITPLLIHLPLIYLCVSLALIGYFMYLLHNHRYIFFNMLAAITVTLILIAALKNPTNAFDITLIWILGCIMAVIVVKVSIHLCYPDLARNHLQAALMGELRTSFLALLSNLNYIANQHLKDTRRHIQAPEKFIDLYTLLAVAFFESKKTRLRIKHYRELITSLKLFRYQLFELRRLTTFFDSQVKPENQVILQNLVEQFTDIYQEIFQGFNENQVIPCFSARLLKTLEQFEVKFIEIRKRGVFKSISLDRIYAFTCVVKLLEDIAQNLQQIINFSNLIIASSCNTPTKNKTINPNKPPLSLHTESLQFALKFVIGIVIIIYLNLALGWFNGVNGALEALITYIVVMYRPHAGRSLRYSFYRFLGVFIGAIGAIVTLILHTLLPSTILLMGCLFFSMLAYAYFAVTDEKHAYLGIQASFVYSILVLSNDATTTSFTTAFSRLQGVFEGTLLSVIMLFVLWHVKPIKQIKRYLKIILEGQAEIFTELTKTSLLDTTLTDTTLSQIEEAMMNIRDIIDDAKFVPWSRTEITPSLIRTVQSSRQLTFAVKSFEQARFNAKSAEFREHYLPQIQAISKPLQQVWHDLSQNILLDDLQDQRHYDFATIKQALAKLLGDIRKHHEKKRFAMSSVKDFSLIIISLQNIVVLLETMQQKLNPSKLLAERLIRHCGN